jgi:hypothetical protein
MGTRRLRDLVAIATQAQRANCGDLVWYSWVPVKAGGGEGQCKLSRASTLLGVTRPGARQMLSAVRAGALGKSDWDISLRHWLATGADGLRYSWVWPPIGNYAEHPSGCDPAYATGRPTNWSAAWTCEGTRRPEDAKDRQKWLMKFGQPGVEWVQTLQDEPDDIHWKSSWAASAGPVPETVRRAVQ